MKKSHIVLLSFCAAFLCILLGVFITRNLMHNYFLGSYEPNSSKQSSDAEGKININTAPAEELMLLPGIGELTAQRIIEYRIQNGQFTSIEQLSNVKGIGQGTMDKIRDYITTGG